MPTDEKARELRCRGQWKGERCDRYLGEATATGEVLVICARCGTRNVYEVSRNTEKSIAS